MVLDFPDLSIRTHLVSLTCVSHDVCGELQKIEVYIIIHEHCSCHSDLLARVALEEEFDEVLFSRLNSGRIVVELDLVSL